MVNADFTDAVTDGLDVPEKSVGDAAQAGGYERARLLIANGAFPFAKCVRLLDQERDRIVTLILRSPNINTFEDGGESLHLSDL